LKNDFLQTCRLLNVTGWAIEAEVAAAGGTAESAGRSARIAEGATPATEAAVEARPLEKRSLKTME